MDMNVDPFILLWNLPFFIDHPNHMKLVPNIVQKTGSVKMISGNIMKSSFSIRFAVTKVS